MVQRAIHRGAVAEPDVAAGGFAREKAKSSPAVEGGKAVRDLLPKTVLAARSARFVASASLMTGGMRRMNS